MNINLLLAIFRYLPFHQQMEFIYDHPDCDSRFKDILNEEFRSAGEDMHRRCLERWDDEGDE